MGQVEQEIKVANEKLKICRKVKHTLATPGWRETIHPLIEKMIRDIVGGKTTEGWDNGLLSRARKDERREFYIGYKQYGIDLHNKIYDHISNEKKLIANLKDLTKERVESEQFEVPLLDGGY